MNIKTIYPHKVWLKSVAIGLVCLFTVNSVALSYTDGASEITKNTLATQSIFRPLTDQGIENSAQLQFEIIAGAQLIHKGKTCSAVNGFLTETHRHDNGKRRVEFLKGSRSEDGVTIALFKIVGSDATFEIRYDGAKDDVVSLLRIDQNTIGEKSYPARIDNSSQDPKAVRKSLKSSEYSSRKEDFRGVDLEHFVWAQYKLAEKSLSPDVLKNLRTMLKIDRPLDGDSLYNAIYEELVKGRYTKEVIDLINGDTYQDPRLIIELVGQNKNPRAQGIYEAISNSLDALGSQIGQFGKGVKQIIDWLEATGKDRIDVLTVKEGNLSGHCLTILKDSRGQHYIEIKEISAKAFRRAAKDGALTEIEHGTIVRVYTDRSIPARSSAREGTNINSQESIIEGIHRRFPFVSGVNIFTKSSDEKEQKQINDFGNKVVIVPPGGQLSHSENRDGKIITVTFTGNTVTIADSGKGMGPETISRMFVPKEGTKHPAALSDQAAVDELEKVKVIHDEKLPHRVSFARSEEVIKSIDIPKDIASCASAGGGLMIEFGALLDVPESRDNIIIPLNLKGGPSNFQLAVEYAVNEIIKHPGISDEAKIVYINTIVIGLDELVLQNASYDQAIKHIRANTAVSALSLVQRLKSSGYVILPHHKDYEKLVLPKGRKTLFLHESLFDWKGAVSMKELGAEMVAGVTLAGEKKLPLLVADFKPGDIENVSVFRRLWHTWTQGERLPVIKTDRFIAIPRQLGSRLLELAAKRIRGLSAGEDKEFASLLERVNIMTGEEVVTHYEIANTRPNIMLESVSKLRSSGEIDSEAINTFLIEPPMQYLTPGASQRSVPEDANQKYVCLANGDIMDVATGEAKITGVLSIEPMTNGYYRTEQIVDKAQGLGLFVSNVFKISAERGIRLLGGPARNLEPSPDKRHLFVTMSGPSPMGAILYDLHTDKNFYLDIANDKVTDFSTLTGLSLPKEKELYTDFVFSQDSRYAAFVWQLFNKNGDKLLKKMIVVIDLARKKVVNKINVEKKSDLEFGFNRYLNSLLTIKDKKGRGGVFNSYISDQQAGINGYFAKTTYTSPDGAYTLMETIKGERLIRLNKSGRLLAASDFGAKDIMAVRNICGRGRSDKPFYQVILKDPRDPNKSYFFNEDGETSSFGDEPIPAWVEEWDFDSGELRIITYSAEGRVNTPTLVDEDTPDNLYKHPKYNLYIDISDDNPLAIDPVSGKVFYYQGEIFKVERNKRDGLDIWSADDDKIYCSYSDASPVEGRSPANHMVSIRCANGSGEFLREGAGNYEIVYVENSVLSPRATTVSFSKYTAASFDGKYFVLVDPETGDVAYLDPEKPDEPVYVDRKITSSRILATEKPADAPERFVMIMNPDHKYSIWDTRTKSKVRPDIPGFDKLTRCADNIFNGQNGTDNVTIIVDPDNTAACDITSYRDTGWHSKLFMFDGRAVIARFSDSGNKYISIIKNGHLIDIGGGNRDCEIMLSFSGRFSAHCFSDSELFYYDHDEANPKPRRIHLTGKLEKFAISPYADVLFIKNKGEKHYQLFSLTLDDRIGKDLEHIEIDSSGTFAICKRNGWLFYINLKTGEVSKNKKLDTVWVSSDDNFAYLMWGGEGSSYITLEIYDRDGKLVKKGRGGEEPKHIRFHERYFIDRKYICDESHGRVHYNRLESAPGKIWGDGIIWYEKNPPIEPEESLALDGSKAVYRKGAKSVLIDLENTSATCTLNLGSDMYKRLLPLKGNNIWYVESLDGTITNVMEKFDGNYESSTIRHIVNKDKTYLIDGFGHLTKASGPVKDLRTGTDFSPTDVSGKYFVLTNIKTGEIVYLDPDNPAIGTARKLPAAAQAGIGRNELDSPPIDSINMKYGFTQDGLIMPLGSRFGKEREPLIDIHFNDIKSLEPLINGYYKMEFGEFVYIFRADSEKGIEVVLAFHLRDGAKIVISPDKNFIFAVNREGKIFKAFNCTEDREPPSIKNAEQTGVELYDPQFSKSNEHTTILCKTTDNRYFLTISPKARKDSVPVELGDEAEGYEYALNPFAEVAFVRSKKTGRMQLIDLDTGLAMARDAKFLRTDSTGTYTVIVDEWDNMHLYFHKTKIIAPWSSRLTSNYHMNYVQTIWGDGDTPTCRISFWDGKAYADAYFDEEGEYYTIPDTVKNFSCYETIGITCGFELSGQAGSKPDWSNFDITRLDPLQRLDKPGYYKHPVYDLLISAKDADNPVAMDINTGATFNFKGEIIYYRPIPEDGVNIYSLHEGKIYANTALGPNNGSSNFALSGNIKPEFMVLATIDAELSRSYKLFNKITGSTALLRDIPHSKYTHVTFEGKYFVFLDPKTCDAVFLDPKKPNEPIFVPMQRTDAPVLRETDQGKEMKLAIELWQKSITPERDKFIEQARKCYGPFLELVPEEFRPDSKEPIKHLIDALYSRQEEEVKKRFSEALAGKELDLKTPPLPFDRFETRMAKATQALKAYIEASSARLSQERIELRKRFYVSLFNNVFELGREDDAAVDDIDADLLEVLGLGWHAGTVDQVQAIKEISSLVAGLKKSSEGRIGMETLMKIVGFLCDFTSGDQQKNIPIVTKQLNRIFGLKKQAKNKILTDLYLAFENLDIEDALKFVKNPSPDIRLGNARPFVVFLTNDVKQVRTKDRLVPKGEDRKVPQDGVYISQVIKLEQDRKKMNEDDIVMDMDYLLENMDNLPAKSEGLESDILRNATVQRESGAWAAEVSQNTIDAAAGKKELVLDCYLQHGSGGELEYVEEAKDDATGALKEVALIIPKSTKALGEQKDLAGFFGTGKYTIFEGIDRLEIINKNSERAYMFTFLVLKDSSGKPVAIKLTGIREVTDDSVKRGVTLRRIKFADNTIPELDQMLTHRAWMTFAGLAQNDDFKIYFIDYEGQRQPLAVEKTTLSQSEPEAPQPRIEIISAKDMPFQVVDRVGLRVSEIKEEYLALIPASLRKFISELGIVIRIPLPLIRNRSAFEHEDENLTLIQKHIAIEFYRAIAYKTMTQTNPQFVFEGFPMDWETNEDYWNSVNPAADAALLALANRINSGRYGEVSEDELKSLLVKEAMLDKEKRFVKLILMLDVLTDRARPGSKTSLLARRLAVVEAARERLARMQKELLESGGLRIADLPDRASIPYFGEKVGQAKSIITAHDQMRHPEKYIIDPKDYSEADRELVAHALSIAMNFGIEDVVLLNPEVSFAGAFKNFKGKHTMFLSSALSYSVGAADSRLSSVDKGTGTIIHELAHLLEELMRRDNAEKLWADGYVAHLSIFTHDSVGTFAEAMKYAAAVSLANHNDAGSVFTGSASTLTKSDRAQFNNRPNEDAPKISLLLEEYITQLRKDGIYFNPGLHDEADENDAAFSILLQHLGDGTKSLEQLKSSLRRLIEAVRNSLSVVDALGKAAGLDIPKIDRILLIHDKDGADISAGRVTIGDKIYNDLILNLARLLNKDILVDEMVPEVPIIAHELGHIVLGYGSESNPYLSNSQFNINSYGSENHAVKEMILNASRELAAFRISQELIKGTEYEGSYKTTLERCLNGEHSLLPVAVSLLVVAERGIPLGKAAIERFKNNILSNFNGNAELFDKLYHDFMAFYELLKLKRISVELKTALPVNTVKLKDIPAFEKKANDPVIEAKLKAEIDREKSGFSPNHYLGRIMREFIRHYASVRNMKGSKVIELGYSSGGNNRVFDMLMKNGVDVTGIGLSASETEHTHKISYSAYLQTLPADSVDIIYSIFSLYAHSARNTGDIMKTESRDGYHGLANPFPNIVKVLKPGGLLITICGKEEAGSLLTDEELLLLGLEKVVQYQTRGRIDIGYIVTVLRKKIPQTTVTTTLSIKETGRLSSIHRGEESLLGDIRHYLVGHPVNMRIDLATMPRVGLMKEQQDGELGENIETIARLIAWHNSLGLDIRYVLENDDADNNALQILKRKLGDIGKRPGVDLNELLSRVGPEHRGSNVIDISLKSLESINAITQPIPDNAYYVALKDDPDTQGVAIPNYTMAANMGLALAALRIAKDKDGYAEVRGRMVKTFRDIYRRYGVISGDDEFKEDQLDLMVCGSSETKKYYTVLYALPPIIKAAIEELKKYHESLRLLLRSA